VQPSPCEHRRRAGSGRDWYYPRGEEMAGSNIPICVSSADEAVISPNMMLSAMRRDANDGLAWNPTRLRDCTISWCQIVAYAALATRPFPARTRPRWPPGSRVEAPMSHGRGHARQNEPGVRRPQLKPSTGQETPISLPKGCLARRSQGRLASRLLRAHRASGWYRPMTAETGERERHNWVMLRSERGGRAHSVAGKERKRERG